VVDEQLKAVVEEMAKRGFSPEQLAAARHRVARIAYGTRHHENYIALLPGFCQAG
jgi:hypothetical protein